MSVKSEVSTVYLEQLKRIHGPKQYLSNARVLMTGATRAGSIGMRIGDFLERNHNKVDNYVGDVRDAILTESIAKASALVMCHGVSHLDWLEDAPANKVEEIVEVNLTSTIKLTQAYVNATIEAPYRKVIIAIGSMAYKAVLNGSAAYCASKAGLAHFMRCAAWELAPKGFDVYCIHPSNTLGTPMSEETIAGLMRYRGLSRKEAEAYWNDTMLRDQSLTTDEIARLVTDLVAGRFPYLSGSQLELAGGQR